MAPASGIRTAIYALSFIMCSAGCLFEPSGRILSPEEEQQLQKQLEYTYTLPQDQQALGQKQVECIRASMEQRDCEGFVPAKELNVINHDARAIEAVIDKNLSQALERSKK